MKTSSWCRPQATLQYLYDGNGYVAVKMSNCKCDATMLFSGFWWSYKNMFLFLQHDICFMLHNFPKCGHACVTCALCCRTFPSAVIWLYNITCLCDVCFMLQNFPECGHLTLQHHMLVWRVLYVAELSRVRSSDFTTSHAWTNSTCAKIWVATPRSTSCSAS